MGPLTSPVKDLCQELPRSCADPMFSDLSWPWSPKYGAGWPCLVPKFGLLWKSRRKLPWQVPAPQRWFSTEELQSGDLGRKWLDLPNELVLFHNCWKKMFANSDIPGETLLLFYPERKWRRRITRSWPGIRRCWCQCSGMHSSEVLTVLWGKKSSPWGSSQNDGLEICAMSSGKKSNIPSLNRYKTMIIHCPQSI